MSAARRLLEDLRRLARGLALVAGGAPWAAAAYGASALAISATPVLQVWLAKRVVDALTLPSAAAGSPLLLAVLYGATLLVPGALQPVNQALMAWIESRAVAEVDRRLMHAGAQLADLHRVERPTFQDDLRHILDRSHLAPGLFHTIQNGLGGIVTLGGLYLLLGALHPAIPLAIIAITVPHLTAEKRVTRTLYQKMGQQSRTVREMAYCLQATTTPQLAKEVRVFALGDFFLSRFHRLSVAVLRELSQVRLAAMWPALGFALVHGAVLGGSFWYVLAQHGAGRLTLGDLTLYVNAVMQAEQRTAQLGSWFRAMYESVLYLRQLFDLLDSAAPSIPLPHPAKALPAPLQIQRGIELRDVRFAYPETPAPVLDGVSATLPAGKITALVGANGAGKSTLVKLLTRMYTPAAGEILLDDQPFAAFDLASLRRQIAVVYQDFARFPLTLAENIAVGAAGDPSADLRQAAHRSGADAIAAKLPLGYDTPLTRQYEGGVDLSGGEWQKTALARAFIRDAALVILDEPTAALDADAEHGLFEQFRRLMHGKTALIISHRFSTVRLADHILVLENGRIAERGSHEDLLALNGRYATLFEMQAGRYR